MSRASHQSKNIYLTAKLKEKYVVFELLYVVYYMQLSIKHIFILNFDDLCIHLQ